MSANAVIGARWIDGAEVILIAQDCVDQDWLRHRHHPHQDHQDTCHQDRLNHCIVEAFKLVI